MERTPAAIDQPNAHPYPRSGRSDGHPVARRVADDLATLMPDAAIEEEGFVRSGIHPFLFPGS
ncbi:formate dehydrogenase accessory protein FdhE [Neisseriaceae bacterium B2N2-7]|uniref:Formate dehydrogenase accessory protein FdhE n=1 Tax=Craterilacuibacter sinensis TaxID=2686017 RepID=A0A845BN86_9NEIS|nr:formate dehydrogenase accessory protein FdhE [Craterilacuibacter sinensis]